MAIEAPAPEQNSDEQAAESTAERLFRYSAWIHVGPGADACEDIGEDPTDPRNECSNPLHFHAWVRLPNQFQHETIREKALAAKGRRIRQLRDPSTDAHDALESSLDELARGGDAIKDDLVAELVAKDRWKHLAEAAREVSEIEDPNAKVEDDEEPPKLYAHVAEDQARYEKLHLDGQQDSDEYRELEAHLRSYDKALADANDRIVAPIREALAAKDVNDLVDMIREQRIRRDADEHFMQVYSRNEWLMCSYTHPGGPRRFPSPEALDDCAPEVYFALKETFDDLEQSQNMGVVSGNS